MRLMFVLSLVVVCALAYGKSSKSGQLKTSHDFSALKLKGQSKSPSEAAIFGESAKQTYDLLTVRKHFKDRVKKDLKETR